MDLDGSPLPPALSWQMTCSTCPHEHHLLPCDFGDCGCESPPIPGITL